MNRADIPKYLVLSLTNANKNQNYFPLLRNNNLPLFSSRWYYLGNYRIAHLEEMTTAQWHNVSERVKAQKTQYCMIQTFARKFCTEKNIAINDFREQVDNGRFHFDVLVVECIAFDRQLYQRLQKQNTDEVIVAEN
jgi:hypothetical protein